MYITTKQHSIVACGSVTPHDLLFSEHEFYSVESDKPAILFLFLYSFSFKVSFIFFQHLCRLRLYSLRVVVIIITIMIIIIFIIIIAISYDLYFVSLLLLYLCFF